MSPYPARINRADLIVHAQQIIEHEDVEGLTLGKLAAQIGVKAASLYNHFDNKAALLRAINELTMRGLVTAMREAEAAVPGSDAVEKLRAMANAYRAYAHAYPISYGLAFSNQRTDVLINPTLAEQLALPLQAVIAPLTTPDNALSALRGGWALLHGFVMLELGGHFQRGADLDEAFASVLDHYLRGLPGVTP